LETRLAPANVDVLTFHNDDMRSAANRQEDILTPANVNSTQFGRLFSYQVDGYVYAQPLYKADLTITDAKGSKSTHNVVFVATEHDSVYAFDADQQDAKKGGGLLWRRSLIDPAQGIGTVPFQDIGSSDIVPEIGVTGTPVIDAASGTLYVVPKTKEVRSDGVHYVHKMYALDFTTGLDKVKPVTIGETMFLGGSAGDDRNYVNDTRIVVAGEGQGNDGLGHVPFNSLRALQRPSLVLSNGTVYVAFASHGDTQPYHGWVIGYGAKDLSLQTWLNTSPDNGLSGIWQSGGGPAVDPEGNLYFSTGNGGFTGFARGPQALGQPGGSLGYGGLDYYAGVPPIRQSVAVKFDSFKPTPSHPMPGGSSTGLYVNGHEPLNDNLRPGDVFEDLGPSGIDFTAAGLDEKGPHTFEVTLTYNGKTLSETLTDLTIPKHTFTTSYPVDIPAQVGGDAAYVGFTGGTGATWGTLDIVTWNYGKAINHSAGFAEHSDLTANTAVGRNLTPRPVFVENVARLTTAANQSGSIFSNDKVDITNFSTTFTFQMHPPSSPNQISDGITFTILAGTAGRDFGESVLKLSTEKGLQRVDSFTPRDQQQLNINDTDLGSGATILLPDVGRGQFRNLAVETGKSGHIYLLDRDNMGGYHGPPILPDPGEDHVVQVFRTGVVGVWGSPAFWENRASLSEPPEQLVRIGFLYYHGSGDVLKSFDLVAPADGSGTPRLRLAGQSPPGQPPLGTNFPFPGGQPVVSANGAQNGIVWDADVHLRGERSALGPAELFAYNAENVSQVLYHSNETSRRDLAGNAVKFVSPTVTNGHVYLGTQYRLDVYGLFEDSGIPPTAAPSKLTVAPEPDQADTQLILSWTNIASNATGIRIERATQSGGPFAFVAIVPRQATTFTDTGLTPSTRYFYRLVALNQHGESKPSETADATTLIPRTVLSVADVGATAISLSWTRVQEADDRYEIYRSTDGGAFELAGMVPADQTSFRDDNHGAGLPRGRYSYRVDAFSMEGVSRSSNVVSATIGPIRIDHSDGFTDLSGLQENGDAKFAEAVARLADGANQTGSVFALDRLGIRTFTTTFTFRIHEGTDPRGEGFTFVIQADPRETRVLGPGGGGLGYGPETPRASRGIVRSVALKFDLFDNAGEGANSTGIFSGGRSPTIRDPALSPDPTPDIPDQSVDLDGTGIELNNQRTKQVRLTYDGTTLEETITDLDLPAEFTRSYAVNIPGIVGSDTAFVGFTGGTSSRWTLFDIRTWAYDEGDESGLAPRRPLQLRGRAQGLDVNLDWRTANAYTAEGYVIERSTALRGPFDEVVRVSDPNLNSRTDTVEQPGVYYYRVRAFNAAGDSAPSNVIQVTVHGSMSSSGRSDLPDGLLAGTHANAHRRAVDQLFGSNDFEVL
jgi:hypothetical protein